MAVINDGINFSKYNRAFYFGCSFTDYQWPTWADIISQEIPNNYKYAQCGAGNFYIYQALIEAHTKHKFCETDLVMVMFSNVTREDRYTDQEGWFTPGNIIHQSFYDKNFLDRFFSEKGYLMRDLTLIEGIDIILSNTSADYSLMSMINLDSATSDSNVMNGVENVLEYYKDTISKIKPNVFEVIFNSDWNTREPRPKYTCHWSDGLYTDNHPTPLEHLEYLQKVFPNTEFKKDTIDKVNTWQKQLFTCHSYQEFIDMFSKIIMPKAPRL